MSVISVGSAADLLRVLQSAQDGDVVQLDPGNYSAISIRDLKLSNVTIESRDPAQLAVLSELLVRGSTGLIFHNLEFAVDPAKAGNSFFIRDSAHIQFDGLSVHGTLDRNPGNDRSGLMIRNSEDVSVTNSEFQQLWNAIDQLDNRTLVITNNSFHDIRTDAIRGGGTSDVLIARNFFTDFYPAPGDHGDAIQFWTSGTTASAGNIVVTENVIVRGSGGIAQGIFFRDQIGSLPFENVTVSKNLVSGMMYSGIAVLGARGVEIVDNIVEAFPDMKSWIRVQDVDGATLAGNQSFAYLKLSSSNINELANIVNGYVSDGGLGALNNWLKDHGAVGQHGEVAPPPSDIWESPAPFPGSIYVAPGVQHDELPPVGVSETVDLQNMERHLPADIDGAANDLMIIHGFGYSGPDLL